MDKKMTAIIAAVIVVVIVAAAAVVMMGNNNGGNGNEFDGKTIDIADTLSDSDISEMKESAKKDSKYELKITSDKYEVVFNNAAVKTFESAAKLNIDTVKVSDLETSVSEAIGTNAAVYNISFGSNVNFGSDGKATITVPYTLASGESAENVKVYYIDSENNLTLVTGAVYKDGKVTFSTNHFSKYAITAKTVEMSIKVADFEYNSNVRLAIFGNVNGDDYLDKKDVTLLRQLLSREITYDPAIHCFADANQDGVLDSADIALIEDFIAGKKSTMYYWDITQSVASIPFPLSGSKIGVHHVYPLDAMIILGEYDNIVGMTNQGFRNSISKDPQRYPGLSSTDNNLGTPWEDAEMFMSFVTKGMNVFILPSTTDTTNLQNDIKEAGYNVTFIRLAMSQYYPWCADLYGTLLMLGVFFQDEERAHGYVDFVDGMLDEINKGVEGLETKTFISPYDNDTTDTVDLDSTLPNGKAMGDVYTLMHLPLKSVNYVDEKNICPVVSLEWVANTNPDVIITITFHNYTWSVERCVAETDELAELFAGTGAYDRGDIYFVNYYNIANYGGLPQLYLLASYIWPDLFSEAKGWEYLQHYYSNFTAYENPDVTQMGNAFPYRWEKELGSVTVDPEVKINEDTLLRVFGNVNGDNVIDKYDVIALKNIIRGRAAQTYFADANQDGVLDQKDVDVIQKLINGEETLLYYMDYSGKACSVKVPVGDINVVYYQVLDAVVAMGAFDKVIAVDNASYSYGDKTYNGISAKTNMGDYKTFSAENLMATGATVTVTGSSKYYMNGIEENLPEGYYVVRLCNSAGAMGITWHVTTLGYILGCQEGAAKYVDWFNNTISDVQSKVQGESTPTLSAIYSMTSCVEHLAAGSGVYEATLLAGTDNLESSYTESMYHDVADAQYLYSQNPDWLIVTLGKTGMNTNQEGLITKYDSWMDTWKVDDTLGAVANGKSIGICYNLLNGMMLPLGTALIASIIHSDVYGKYDYIAAIQEYYNEFTLMDVDVSTGGWLYYPGDDVNKGGWYSWDPTMVRVDGAYSNCTPSFMSIAEQVYRAVYGGQIPDYSGITIDKIPEQYLYKYADYTSRNDNGKFVVKTFDNTSDGKSAAFADKVINFVPTTVVAYTDAYVDTIYMIFCDYYGEKDHCGQSPKAEAATWALCSVMPSSVKTNLQKNYGLTVPDSVKVIGTSKEDLTAYAGTLTDSDKVIVLMTEYNIRSTSTSGWWANNQAIEENCPNMQFVYLLSNSPAMVLSTIEMIGELIGCTNTETMMTSILAEIYVMQKAIDDSGKSYKFYVETTSKKVVASNTLMGAIFDDILKMTNVTDSPTLMGASISDEVIVTEQPDVIGFYKADSRTDDQCMRVPA